MKLIRILNDIDSAIYPRELARGDLLLAYFITEIGVVARSLTDMNTFPILHSEFEYVSALEALALLDEFPQLVELLTDEIRRPDSWT
jgi:hypothetical protein